MAKILEFRKKQTDETFDDFDNELYEKLCEALGAIENGQTENCRGCLFEAIDLVLGQDAVQVTHP